MFRKLLISAGLALVVFGTAIAATFDGAPSVPTPYTGTDLDVQVHSRDVGTWYDLESMQAEHGANCSAPPATHENHTYAGAVFQCANHLMTSLNATGYGVIYLTPNEMVDFSGGEAVIKWDVSSMDASDRDWWDVWITPYASNMALPLEPEFPDLNGVPANSVHLKLDDGGGKFCPQIYYNGVGLFSDDFTSGCKASNWVSQFLVPSATVRATWEVRISATHLKMTLLSANGGALGPLGAQLPFVWFDKDIPALPFTQGVVQWGHHSYNPTKDGYTPGTWHWDNLSISPSVPFSIQRVGPRYLDTAGSFSVPSGMLRFSAICKVKVNGQLVAPQKATNHTDHFNSYFVPVPGGTATIEFAADSGYSSPCFAKDFHIWNLSGGPTATPTTATTATPMPPTATPTNTPVPPTATPTRTPTPTPQPRYRCQVRQGNNWVTVWDQSGSGVCP